MSQLQNYTVTAIANANLTGVQRWRVSANVLDDNGVDLGVFSFNWPDAWINMTGAQRKQIADLLAPQILRVMAGLAVDI